MKKRRVREGITFVGCETGSRSIRCVVCYVLCVLALAVLLPLSVKATVHADNSADIPALSVKGE